MRGLIVFTIILFFMAMIHTGSIKNSKHNLSGQGKGSLRSSGSDDICIFCHTSHSARNTGEGPLWNREVSEVEYTLYESSSLFSSIGQPDGASKLCLSCHDGTISLGHVLSRKNEWSISNSDMGRIPATRRSNLGKDISDDHPVSFNPSGAVSSSPELRDPDPGDPVMYDRSGKIQCTACHDPHKDTYGKFLVKPVRRGVLCKTCHELNGFSGSGAHDISPAVRMGSGEDPRPSSDLKTVAENSCFNCHRAHNAAGEERLLISSMDSEICLGCHDGSTGPDILTEFRKNYSHGVTAFDQVHDPAENILTAPVHAQCVDCHDPHRVNSSGRMGEETGGKLSGVSGMNESGSIVAEASFAFEVCLKCHGQERYNSPAVGRIDQNPDIRTAFLPSNASHHGVMGQGNAGRVPSLRPGWNPSSRLRCTDCHNSDTSKANGGPGPDGPHGSTHNALLERRYLISTVMPYQQSLYDLCWKCHRPEVIMNPHLTAFGHHAGHIDRNNTPCSVCHDPHGSRQNPGLLNFDISAVFPSFDGELKFEVSGNKGYCYLQCHGEDHSPKEYDR